MGQSEDALGPMVGLVAEMLHSAIHDGIDRTEDTSDPSAVIHSVWESCTEHVVLTLLRVRDATLAGLHERLDQESESARAMCTPAVTAGVLSSGWVAGYTEGLARAASLTSALTEVDDPGLVAAAAMVDGLPDLLGPIPRPLLTWLAVIATGATPDPAGWLRMQLKELEA